MPALMIDRSFQDLIEATAARSPTPAGGAAGALTASLGAALMLMVVRFSRGKPSNAAREAELAATEQRLQAQIDSLSPMAERDSAAFDRVSAAYRLPRDTDQRNDLRVRAMEEAMVGAMSVPEELICVVRDVLATVVSVADCIGANLTADMGSGVELLSASANSALLNIRTNAGFLMDRAIADAAVQRARSVHAEVEKHRAALRDAVEAHL